MGVIRKTKSVQAILEIFESNSNAISVVDLIEQLQGSMNKTTIYRILERLDQDAVLHSFLGQDGVKWYAKCHECKANHHNDVHPHFQCDSCGITECLEVEVMVPQSTPHNIKSAQVLYTGVCDKCLNN